MAAAAVRVTGAGGCERGSGAAAVGEAVGH